MAKTFPRRAVLSGASMTSAAFVALPLAHEAQARAASASLEKAAGGPISVRQFGAIGDGQFHPLSSLFPDLPSAQALYPSAETLEDSLDGAAIQAAIDYAAQRGAALQICWRVHLPAGRYRLSRSIRLPNNVLLTGDGKDASIVDNQNTPLAYPLIVNADPDVVSMVVRDLSLHGGTHGIRINARQYVDGYEFTRVSFQLQSDKNFECNRLLQIGTFSDCVFAKSPFGVFVANWTTNIANFFHCRFEDHSRTSLHLNGAECVNLFGGRFESGGVPGGDEASIHLTRAAAVNFQGVYFEGTHPVLLRESRSRDGVTFAGCHFTGSANPGGAPAPYLFDTEGIVSFGSNDWGTPSPGPARMLLFGTNDGLIGQGRRYYLRSSTDWRISSEQVMLRPGSKHTLLVFRTFGEISANAPVGVQGTLEITWFGLDSRGEHQMTVGVYRFLVYATGDLPISVELFLIDGRSGPAQVTIGATLQQASVELTSEEDTNSILKWSVTATAVLPGSSGGMAVDLD